MDVTTAVRSRRMCRRFDPERPVPDELLTEMLDLAVRAPSAGHTQGWEWVLLTGARDRGRFWGATTVGGEPDRWLRGVRAAPALVLALSDKDAYLDRYAEPDKGWSDRSEDDWPVPYWDTDVAMASMILLLAAQERGVSQLFFGVPAGAHGPVRAAFGIPERLRIVGVIALGYPDPKTANPRSPSLRRGRRRLADVLHRGGFHGA
ncbi:MAG: nitroreductase family protein [Intrasporangiaceae bacterium]|nr:nitroreductase family protein [Intrasporangiaceae bacterium]